MTNVIQLFPDRSKPGPVIARQPKTWSVRTPIWRVFAVRPIVRAVNGTDVKIVGASDWGATKTKFVINSLLESGHDVTVEDFTGTRVRRFLRIKKGTGKFEYAEREVFKRIPVYPGAHRHT